MKAGFIIVPIIISFGLSAGLGPFIIPLLRKFKIGQTVRTEGPKSHLKKSGTPTMGGILILISVTITALIYVKEYPGILPVLFLTLGFGMVGFLDDFIKVILGSSMGLRPWQKMSLQLVVTGAFAWYLSASGVGWPALKIPFWKGYYVDFGIWNLPILFFVVVGTANGTNFTDGLDGLAGSVTVLVATFFMVVAIGTEAGIFPITCAVTGALLGFLLFNVYPASVFMGDTGSLALGGFVAGCAYMLQLPLYLPLIGLVYVAEVLSVVIQVVYYRISGGRRILKMAPLHHHFELCGWKESKIVALFSIITAVLCMLALVV